MITSFRPQSGPVRKHELIAMSYKIAAEFIDRWPQFAENDEANDAMSKLIADFLSTAAELAKTYGSPA